jgi:hypothetical protein
VFHQMIERYCGRLRDVVYGQTVSRAGIYLQAFHAVMFYRLMAPLVVSGSAARIPSGIFRP